MQTETPVLNTDRLVLRWFTEDDAPLLFEIWNSPGFIRYVGDRGIRDVSMARAAFREGIQRQYESLGFGAFCISLKDGTGIGMSGLFSRSELDAPDIGFGILPAWCGQGFAYEASCAVLQHADENLTLPLIYAIVAPDNSASIGLLRKLKLGFQRRILIADEPLMLYSRATDASRTKPDGEATKSSP